jgi:DNA polymerase-3 subunit gamma/tau
VIDLIQAILDREPAVGLDLIHQNLDAGSDPRQFARQIVDYLRNLLLVRMGNAQQIDATNEIRQQMAEQAQAFVNTSEILRVIRTFNHAASEARISWQPSLPLELAIVESIYTPPVESVPAQPKSVQPRTPPPARLDTAAPLEPQAVQSDKSPAQDSDSAPELQPDPTPSNITQNWKRIKDHVKGQNPQTQALLNSCKLLGTKGGVLILGCNGEFTKSKLEQDDNIEILQNAMQHVIGERMNVRCVIASGKSIPDDVDNDGMVATALRDLGGEIVDIQ